MSDHKRRNWAFAGLLVSGVGFNLVYLFARNLFDVLFVFYPVLLTGFGVVFLYLAACGLLRFRRVQRCHRR